MESMKLTSQGKAEWPPKRVWREVDEAALRWDELQAQGRELHFEIDEQRGGLVIELRDLDGDVVDTVSPTEALAIAAGQPPRSQRSLRPRAN